MASGDLAHYQHLTLLNDGRVALWPATEASTANSARSLAKHPRLESQCTVKLALPDSLGRVRRRKVLADAATVREMIDPLANLSPTAAAPLEAQALAAITRVTLAAVADGRVVPRAIDHDRGDIRHHWAVGPWSVAESSDLRRIADHLPPALRAEPVGQKPLKVLDSFTVVTRFADAVADALVSTPAAACRKRALDPVEIGDIEAQLVGSGPVLVARLELTESGARLRFEARNRTDHTERRSASEIWADPAGATVIGEPTPDMWLLRRFKRLGEIWEPLTALLTEAAPSSIELDDDSIGDFLLGGMDRLAATGLEVLLPRDLVKELSVKATVSASSDSESSGVFALEALCEVKVTASLDGSALSAAELKLLIDSQADVVRIRNTFVRVDARLARQLQRRLSGAEALGAALGGQIVLDGEAVELETTGALADLVARVRALDSQRSIETVEGLLAELRPYQQRGVAWLRQISELIGGGILADDMGLGKTMQVIALHLLRNPTVSDADAGRDGPTLVVGPASLVTNWIREFERFAPTVTTHRYHGPERSLEAVAPGDVVVSTYATVRLDRDRLAERDWGMIVADEAQHIKNHGSATARAVRSLPAAVRLGVSGTPVENQLNDLWALTDWTVPGLLGSKAGFRRRFANPIERDGDESAAAQLNRVIAPFVLRRTKSDPSIAPDLPPRTEIDHVVPLSTEQIALYRAMTADVLEQIEQSDGIQRRGLVLKMLTALKQICDHPVLWLDQGGPLVSRSGKLAAFDDLVTEMVDAGDAVLVFTQYVGMGNMLVQRLDQLGISSQFLHGGTSTKVRQEMVDRFQDGSGPAVFIISIKAGGTGLNLTRANQVIHYDRWWNPAVENQASDRAWRIGQTRAVFVHRLTSEGTLEESIARELQRKASLAESVVGSGEGWLSELDDLSLRSLVELSGLG